MLHSIQITIFNYLINHAGFFSSASSNLFYDNPREYIVGKFLKFSKTKLKINLLGLIKFYINIRLGSSYIQTTLNRFSALRNATLH